MMARIEGGEIDVETIQLDLKLDRNGGWGWLGLEAGDESCG